MKWIKYFENFDYNDNNNNNYEFEYQFRDIDSGVYYKRKKGDIIWSFTDEKDFKENTNDYNTITWTKIY